jgi:5-methylcytosine-specific restriction protein A
MFEPGREYRRRELHRKYGGQEQGGISTPKDQPFLLLFSSENGELYGYNDGWLPDGSYRYTGQGQIGDMVFKFGNKAILDHEKNGKTLYLFETTRKAFVRYVGRMRYAGHEMKKNVPDRERRPRTAIIFRLLPDDE